MRERSEGTWPLIFATPYWVLAFGERAGASLPRRVRFPRLRDRLGLIRGESRFRRSGVFRDPCSLPGEAFASGRVVFLIEGFPPSGADLVSGRRHASPDALERILLPDEKKVKLFFKVFFVFNAKRTGNTRGY